MSAKTENEKLNASLVSPETDDKALDQDRDGLLDLDPHQAQVTMVDLVTLDHELRDHGLSLSQLLRKVAATTYGIKLR